jgi:uncharacterized phage protein (TIGR01671 family)
MREFKFRAWDNVKNKMYFTGIQDEVVISFDSNGLVATDITEHDWGFKELHHLKYMQYTGLKDKNGKEIYEGDVVKGYWWEKGKSHRHIGRVDYVMNAFKVRGVKQYLGFDDGLNPSYEIIGNIYENPELLEQSV